MKTVVFYSPHFGANTLRFATRVHQLPDVRVVGLGQDSFDYIHSLNATHGPCFDDYVRVDNASDQQQLEDALTKIKEHYGDIHRLMNIQEQLQLLVSRIREKMGITGLHLETAKKFRDKAYMKQIFKEAKIRCADFQKAENDADARDFIAKNGYPIVYKPLKGAGTENTFLVRNLAELEESVRVLPPSPENPVQLEEFIEGDEGSYETFTINNKIVFEGFTTYHPTPLDAMMNPWIQPIYFFNKDQDKEEFAEIFKVGRQVIKAFKPGTVMTHMEWFRRKKDNRIYAAEIAGRPPGDPIIDLHNFGHDIDLYSEWNNLMINHKFDLKPEPKHHVGCACLRAQGNGPHIVQIEGLDKIRKFAGELIITEIIPPLGTPKSKSYVGEASIFCRGQDYNQVFDTLKYITENMFMYC